MRVEAKKTFTDGFTLSEQELRRFVNVLERQIEKSSDEEMCFEGYGVKFRNGVIAESLTLDDVLSQENVGSGAIVRLKIRIQDRETDPNYAITTEFTKVDEEGESGSKSMRYTVIGEDRDWVFVTSSELEERLGRIKQFALFQKRDSFVSAFTSVLLLIMIMAGFFSIMVVGGRDTSSSPSLYIDQVEAAWKAGDISDPIEAMIALERGNEVIAIDTSNMKYIGYVVVGLVVIAILFWRAKHYFPAYNFYWGDYVAIYDKKQAQGKFIYITVFLLAIIIPLITTFIGNSIF